MDLERGRTQWRYIQRPGGGVYRRALIATGNLISRAATSRSVPIGAVTAGAVAGRFGRGRQLTRQDSAVMRSASRGRKRVRSGSSRRRSGSRLGVTTEQRDSAIRYSPRRGSRRGRKARRFARRVQNVFLRLGALQTFSDTSGFVKTITLNQQAWDGFLVGSTTVTGQDHLFQTFRLAYGTALTTSTVDDYKLFVKTICTDFQFTNNGSTTLIFDFHSLLSRKSYNVAEALDTHLNTVIAETPAQTGFTFTSTDPGYSLFQVPLFCQYWKVMRKWQVQLGAGESTTLQIRIPVNRMIPGKLIESNPQAVPRLTRGLLWSVKGGPYNNAGVAVTAAGSYVWNTQTTISYQIPPASSRTQVATT